jgi:uncharacterized protein YlzI (FlbEa/FlbD family)
MKFIDLTTPDGTEIAVNTAMIVTMVAQSDSQARITLANGNGITVRANLDELRTKIYGWGK